jgi:formylglycine-generating enzyme required for sulfatase activity
LSAGAIIIAVFATVACNATARAAGIEIPGGEFRTALPFSPGRDRVKVATFRLDRTPVTNGEFAKFIAEQPQWRRGKVVNLFADQGYLSHWSNSTAEGSTLLDRPVTRVSWFAASAYCERLGGRLPTWNEWEYVAAADERSRDARGDAAWRQRMLNWYSRPNAAVLQRVGASPANAFGVQDLHGLVWEWVADFNSLLVSADTRGEGDPDITRFCGTGAISMEQKENYAILMRVAMLSSLQARYTTENLGFRCAYDTRKAP